MILYPSICIDWWVGLNSKMFWYFGCLVRIFAVVCNKSCTLGSQMIAVGLCRSQDVHAFMIFDCVSLLS